MAEKVRSILESVFLTLVVVGVIVFSAIIIVKYFGTLFDPLRSLLGTKVHKVYEVTKASRNLPISREPDETIDIGQMAELRRMLRHEQPEELNVILEEYQNLFEKDPRHEYKVNDAYRAFDITDPSYEEFLKKWINACPDKYQPYLAISQYYYARGWEKRGYKWAKETKEEQFKGMQLYFSKAEENLKVALNINPRLIVGYHILIGIYNADGDDAAENSAIEKASALFPHSFLIKSDSLWAKEPRWGGSYVLMEEIAKDAEKYCAANPKLSALYGFIYFDQGRNSRRNKRYEEAIDLFTKAISFGDHWAFYNERAEVYHFYLKEYDRALEDIDRSIKLRPTIDKSYRMRSRIYFAKGNYSDSIDNLHTAEMLRPGDPETKEWREWASKNLLNKGHRLFKTDLHGAIENYSLSVKFGDQNFETYYWRGMAFYRLENFKSALSDLELAMEINPRHFESYRMVDYILARDRQWGKIISYWNKFLELESDHAGAYLERAGAHYHNKDVENALADLKKSCELGNQEACKRYQGLTAKQ
jgi:tetratricopeptide (TPR) repeat protein